MSLIPQNIVSLAEDDAIGAGKNIVAGASVSITRSGGGMASIYSDAAGTAHISLPTVTDSSGELLFYIESGSYIYTIAGVPYPVFVSDKNGRQLEFINVFNNEFLSYPVIEIHN